MSCRGLSKSFGAIEVLSDVDFDVRPGEVVALLGENGAGKSTMSNLMAGVLQPSRGSMTWRGAPYAPRSPAEALDAGVGLIHQELRLLPELSIAENVFVGRLPVRGGRIDRAAMVSRAEEQLRRLGLDLPATRPVKGLSTAAQQLIEIAKALALNARMLILDEPTAALGGRETELLFEQIERLKADGVAFVYISHRLDEIARVADRIVVLRDGAKVAEHDRGDVPVRTVVEQMVGRSVERMFPEPVTPGDEVVLAVEGLSGEGFDDVSFAVRRGEVLGIAGLVGAGRTELVRAVAGADPREGSVRIGGVELPAHDPRAAIRAGLVLVPEDRKLQGLVVEHRIGDNVMYADLGAGGGWMGPATAERMGEQRIRRFGVKGRAGQLASDLSGGNQQKVVIAKWLSRNPRVVILDEPTRGIDVGARASIYDIVNGLAREGLGVVVVSSDLEEVLGLANRILVMSHGRQSGILDRSEATGVRVMELAVQ